MPALRDLLRTVPGLPHYVACIALGLGGVLALGMVRGCGDAPTTECNAYCESLLAIHQRRLAADSVALVEARATVVHDSVTVTRTVTRYTELRDTLNVRDTVQVREYVARADSVVRSCVELQSSCSRFRVRADSVIADLHAENDALRSEVRALTPNRLARVWDRAKVPLAFGAGLYLGARAVR